MVEEVSSGTSIFVSERGRGAEGINKYNNPTTDGSPGASAAIAIATQANPLTHLYSYLTDLFQSPTLAAAAPCKHRYNHPSWTVMI